MHALIIGGAGYIGSHVVREFLDAGHAVAVYDNLSLGRTENLFPEATFVEADILDYDTLLAAMRTGIDAVVHLAAFKAAGESMEQPQKYALNNLNGTVNILNAALDAGVRNIIFSSSAAVYGEPTYIPIDEHHPCNPENFYGFTKLEIEYLLKWYDRLKGLRFAALRYFNAAGYDVDGRITGLENNPANLLPIVMEVAVGKRDKLQIFGDNYRTDDGTCVRDYVHVSDLAAAHVLACDYIHDNEVSLTVNLGSETGVSVKRVVEEARALTGKPIPVDVVGRRPGDPGKLAASAQKAKRNLGWKPRYSDVATLISSTWNVYRKNFPA
ncbi:MAG: UDP-glucose 4-epimerase GalE [Chitinivibrionales bacterium]|nr:UDP-glucose 4-epimerase GalE [Chitinivibrionales bacterium]